MLVRPVRLRPPVLLLKLALACVVLQGGVLVRLGPLLDHLVQRALVLIGPLLDLGFLRT